jgi:hypothetical protein
MTLSNDTIIDMINKSVASLTKATQELGEKAQWRPLDKGRSAAHQAAECAMICDLCTLTFANDVFPEVNWETFMAENNALSADTEKTLATLAVNAEKLCAVVASASAEKLATMVTLPFGPDMHESLAEIALYAYWNNTYHEGQINYIQVLAAE